MIGPSASRSSLLALCGAVLAALLIVAARSADAKSLWSVRTSSLVTDTRASRAGDLVTILIDEESSADKTGPAISLSPPTVGAGLNVPATRAASGQSRPRRRRLRSAAPHAAPEGHAPHRARGEREQLRAGPVPRAARRDAGDAPGPERGIGLAAMIRAYLDWSPTPGAGSHTPAVGEKK